MHRRFTRTEWVVNDKSRVSRRLAALIALSALSFWGFSCEEDGKKQDDAKNGTNVADESLSGTQGDEDIKGMKGKFEPTPLKRLDSITGLDARPETIRPDLIASFCAHVYKLPLKSDFTKELSYFCDDKKAPTKIWPQVDGLWQMQEENIKGVEIESSADGGFSRSVVVAVSQVPIPPKFVKEARIPHFMAANADFGYFQHEGRVLEDLSGSLGGDLQFGKFKLYYKSTNTTSDGKTFGNERTLEFNAYQVQGGNPDIGIATEHLYGSNPNYRHFKTLTITIGTKSGGSVMISLANIEVQNNGYPEDARRVAIDTGTAQTSHVRDGVMLEKADRIVK